MRTHMLLIPFLLLTSCTIVRVQGANPATSIHFGILRLEPAAGARSVSYRIRGIGLVPSTNGTTLGYAREDAVLAYHPEDCRVVIFELPAESRDLFDPLLDPAICQPRRTR